jgi:16S rRNA (cytosine1407-C5)-methyltransferase
MKNLKIFFLSCLKPLRKSIRVNTLKYNTSEFKIFIKNNSFETENIPWCNTGFFINKNNKDSKAIGLTDIHALGGFYIQEASSMLPVEALLENNNLKNKIIGDLTASPGSKSTQIGSKMKGEGVLLTNELSSSRLKSLYSNLERCGVTNSLLTHYDAELLCNILPDTFDYLLLDAPCTGEGTVRKDYKVLENWSKTDAIRMSNLQKKLIVSAFKSLKQGGEMVYSTCTLGKEENSDVVNFLKSKFPNEVDIISLENLFPEAKRVLTKEGFLQVWPHVFDTEGFFVAKIKKKINYETSDKKKTILKNFSFINPNFSEIENIEKLLFDKWQFKKTDNFEWWVRKKEWWLFPKNSKFLFSKIKSDRTGVKIGELHKKGWRTSYEFCSSFGNKCEKNIIEIKKEEVLKVYKGSNLSFTENYLDSEYILIYKNLPVSIGKMKNNIWKNNLPRVLLRDLW